MKLEVLDLKKKLDLDLSQWSLTSNGEILRVIERKEVQGIYFGEIIESIWSLAEEIDHHPDILLQSIEIKSTVITHDEAGVTLKDIEMAKKIDSLLLRFFKISKI